MSIMTKKLIALTIVASFAGVGLTACKSETDNKPAAEVSEPAAEKKDDAKKDEAKKDEGAAAKADAKKDDAKKDDGAAGLLAVKKETSKIEWVGAKVTGDHKGGFKEFTGGIKLDDKGQVSLIKFDVDTKSVFSDNEKLTGHLMAPDFFDVEKFPKATFESTKVTAGADAKMDDGTAYTHTVTGNLDLHGVKKQIAFPAHIDASGDMIVAKTAFNINRFDFGIEYKGKPDDLIKKEVLLKINFEAPKS